MIREDYVSFEIAKLLKEKGFVGEREIGCRCGFYEQNKEYPNQINLVYDDLNNSELEWNECLRFTHQMAMKWLRDTHKIFIEVGFNRFYGTYNVHIFNMIEQEKDPFKLPERFDSYEEACNEAIRYCLINLI